MAFGNTVWANPANPPANHHGEIDYERAAAMGFNRVRFYFNYGIFEDDAAPYAYKQSGFDWIDQNIAWAKAHGITLIVNMHCPQGDFQSNGAGDALWNIPSNRQRFVALWKEIASRYADEPAILGWDLLNEPVVTKSLNQLRDLAAEPERRDEFLLAERQERHVRVPHLRSDGLHSSGRGLDRRDEGR